MSDKPEILFLPPDDRDGYQLGDFERVASQQPLKWDEIPSYLFEEIGPNVSPPKLWAGWRVEDNDMLRIAQEKMPEIVRYAGLDNSKPSYRILTDGRFARKVCELCQIPEEDWGLVKRVFAAKPTGTFDPEIVFTCGSTTDGVVGDAERGRMADLVASGREPEWHLDYLLWRWDCGRSSGLPKARRKPEGEHHPQAAVVSTMC